jgi:type III restriction enzyme
MKLHFESKLPYPATAIEAVCDLFRGQEVFRSEFIVTMPTQSATSFIATTEMPTFPARQSTLLIMQNN